MPSFAVKQGKMATLGSLDLICFIIKEGKKGIKGNLT